MRKVARIPSVSFMQGRYGTRTGFDRPRDSASYSEAKFAKACHRPANPVGHPTFFHAQSCEDTIRVIHTWSLRDSNQSDRPRVSASARSHRKSIPQANAPSDPYFAEMISSFRRERRMRERSAFLTGLLR